MRLKEKVAVVTGSASGIGAETAAFFREEGAAVLGVDIQARDEGDSMRADISCEADAERVAAGCVARFGRIDVLVNCAAVFVLKGVDATAEEWRRSLDVNVMGTALVTKYVSREMRKRRRGAIVNVSSISGFIAQPGFMAYSATKAAIIQMTRNMAMDLAPFGIRANCVCPGTILTRVSYEFMERNHIPLDEFVRTRGSKCMLNRLGEPREVAHPILFLASDEASFITGTTLVVDGGYTAQ
jgi:NAD(P)-dependent dehydrogenase (short-subunit alcohol dehydrogenase family)